MYCVAATIGFMQNTYEVEEGEDSFCIPVEVGNGQIQRDVTVQFDTMDGTAELGIIIINTTVYLSTIYTLIGL